MLRTINRPVAIAVVLCCLLLSAVPAQGVDDHEIGEPQAASWSQWLTGALQRFLSIAHTASGSEEGPGIDPNGVQSTESGNGGGDGESDEGPGIDPNG